MVRNFFFILVLLLILLNSCIIFTNQLNDPEIKAKLTNKFGASNTNITDHIRIDGYYQAYKVFPSTQQETENSTTFDTIYSNYIFFNDGLFLSFQFNKNSNIDSIRLNLKNHMTDISGHYTSSHWGIFKIQDSLIYIQTLSPPGMAFPVLIELAFKIKNNESITFLSARHLQQRNIKAYGEDPWSSKRTEYTVYQFHKADSLPEPVSWLKELEWTWENKADWENYMNSINKKKRK